MKLRPVILGMAVGSGLCIIHEPSSVERNLFLILHLAILFGASYLPWMKENK